MTDVHPLVQGRCPACRGASLFLGSGGHVTCSRLDCPNPTAADDLLHGAGEEDGYDPHAVPTPGQWLRRFNQASTEERLDVIARMLDASSRAATCFEMNHEARLADNDRRAEEQQAAIARVRTYAASIERSGWTGPAIARRICEALDAPAPAATDGRDYVLTFDQPPTAAERQQIADTLTQHRFTALPVDPEAERAATERAVQAAADSERATEWITAHATPSEHCGHLMPAWVAGPRSECTLRPGHQGSHADDRGARWWYDPT